MLFPSDNETSRTSFQHSHWVWKKSQDPMQSVKKGASFVHASSRTVGIPQFPLEHMADMSGTLLLAGCYHAVEQQNQTSAGRS